MHAVKESRFVLVGQRHFIPHTSPKRKRVNHLRLATKSTRLRPCPLACDHVHSLATMSTRLRPCPLACDHVHSLALRACIRRISFESGAVQLRQDQGWFASMPTPVWWRASAELLAGALVNGRPDCMWLLLQRLWDLLHPCHYSPIRCVRLNAFFPDLPSWLTFPTEKSLSETQAASCVSGMALATGPIEYTLPRQDRRLAPCRSRIQLPETLSVTKHWFGWTCHPPQLLTNRNS